MKNIISLVGIIAVLGVAAGEARGVAMNANIRRLLQEKQDKVAKLEECEGKKQGWMIAGISTIGLTAVGVGVNIAQASKSNKLSNEIDASKSELVSKQSELNRVNEKISDINAKKAEKAEEERKRAEEEQRRRDEREKPRADEEVAGTIGEECGENKIWSLWTDGDKKCYSDKEKENVVSCKCDDIPVVGVAGAQSGQGSTPSGGSSGATNGRVVGGACIGEDIEKLKPYGWTSGTYIRVTEAANSKTVLKARCETNSGAGNAVPCNCKATACDNSKNFELGSNGLCVKKAAEEKEEEKKQETAEEKKEEQKAPTNQEVILDASVDGIDHCYHIIGQKGYKDCSSSDDWGVTFPNYEVYGEAVCNDDLATPLMVSVSEQTETGGLNCWCKMTRPQESNWVFLGKNSNTDYCKKHCAYECSNLVWHNATFREVLFGSTK